MGLDAYIAVRGTFTQKDIDLVRNYFNRADWKPAFNHQIDLFPSGIRIYSGHRWYGEGYERGHWPSIYADIRKLEFCFPENDVIYYDDNWSGEEALKNVDYVEAVSTESLEMIWQYYLGLDKTKDCDRIEERI